jgi:hypothetical protein
MNIVFVLPIFIQNISDHFTDVEPAAIIIGFGMLVMFSSSSYQNSIDTILQQTHFLLIKNLKYIILNNFHSLINKTFS